LAEAQWDAIHAMSANDGSRTNEEAYFERMRDIYGPEIEKDVPLFYEYYEKEFDQVQQVCGFNPESGPFVQKLKDMGYRLILATNSWFPRPAIEARLKWAGVEKDLFEYISLMDNSHYCKPKLEYYEEILQVNGLKAEECLMVGNDVREDMIARDVGMDVFLLPKDLINRDHKDISQYPNGSLDDLKAYIEKILG
jgi:FMN phosphatase YigB (HAD superfamily)